MKTTAKICALLAISTLLGLNLLGCDTDDPVNAGEELDVRKAADLAGVVQGPAVVGGTMNVVDAFRDPMSGLVEGVGIEDGVPLGEGLDDGGVTYDYPSKALTTARAVRGLADLRAEAAAMACAPDGVKARLIRHALEFGRAKADGDTVAAVYHDGPLGSGVDALIETDTPDVLCLVSTWDHPEAGPLQVARRESEILLDSNGTLDSGDDDRYFRVSHDRTLGCGARTRGLLVAEDGVSAIEQGVVVRAWQRTDDPLLHPLQSWNESEIILDPGDFESEGDEIFHSLSAVVHWLNDAESAYAVEPVGAQAIGPETDVTISGTFTAAPGNVWLESTEDVLTARLGDLEDETDDLLLELERRSTFDATAADGGSARSLIRLTPDAPIATGEEPCGGTALQDVHYPADWPLAHLERTVDVDCDGSGTMTVTQTRADGAVSTRTVTWDGRGGATLAETRPDGTVIAGSFDESTGGYTQTLSFPDGHDPVSIARHGTATEGAVEAWETVTWRDGRTDETYFSSNETETGVSFSGHRIEGELREDFTLLVEADGGSSGTWERNDGAVGDYELELLEGGGQHLLFSASEPNEPGSPSVAGDIDFAPDGSGVGLLTLTQYGGTLTFTIIIGADGTGTLVDPAGNSVQL